MEYSPEKMRKELEEELKMSSEEPRSHAWYHGAIPRQVAESLVQRDGDFLIRDSLSSPGSYVLTCQWRNTAQHFKINRKVLALNEAYSRVEYRLEREAFDSLPALVHFYVGNRKPVSQVVGAIIFQPINRELPLRCLEEKYGMVSVRTEAGLTLPEGRSQKRLSLNIMNGHAHDNAHGNNSMGRGNLLRVTDRCGSQPASLNHVQERRRPLQTHQSESFLPLGCRGDPLPSPRCPVVRTGSEPALSPSVPRRTLEPTLGQPIRGSDSQLCPRPPPKPSKVSSLRLPRSPALQPLAALTSSSSPSIPASSSSSSSSPSLSAHSLGTLASSEPPEEEGRRRRVLDRSSYHLAIAALENTSEEEEEGGGGVDRGMMEEEEEEEEGRRRRRRSLGNPVMETASAFRPAEFESHLLPVENKPLEMSVLKRAKELLLSHHNHSIAMHLLLADCQVARILGVSAEVEGQMGVASGVELVTLPHGGQLRLDLMERHHTLAIGVAVDILGCTGSVEERASTLNRIILVAVELKDIVGDLFSFTALMKALDLPQIVRLEQTWTTLRRGFTETAITYEKTLKPFYKSLYEGTGFQADEDLLEVMRTDFQLRLLWGSRGAAVNQSDRYAKFNLILTALSRKLEL
ncbi:breast cancer anti-estrogen resistance protein 3 [Aplochiton taeniatus]